MGDRGVEVPREFREYGLHVLRVQLFKALSHSKVVTGTGAEEQFPGRDLLR